MLELHFFSANPDVSGSESNPRPLVWLCIIVMLFIQSPFMVILLCS